jgi:hypothetical protein
MYPYQDATRTLANEVLDVNHDDYYGTNAGRTDVRQSNWLIQLPASTLTVAVTGTGASGKITGPGVDCPSSCAAAVDSSGPINLTAQPDPGSRFVGWNGACTGTATTCTVSLTSAQSVTAAFAPALNPLTVTVAGKGVVVSSVGGTRCSTRCRAMVESPVVVLRAIPARGWKFAGWSTGCGTHTSCRVDLRSTSSVGARFMRAEARAREN